MPRITRFPSVSVELAMLVSLLLVACREQQYDPDFDTSVAEPAYAREGPRVLFDEAHHNRHTATTGYKPFADLLSNDGYRVERVKQPFTGSSLEGYDVLVIVGAMGPNDAGDEAAFSTEEIRAVSEWIDSGGALLLVIDHYPFGSAVQDLTQQFGVTVGEGFTEDSLHYDRNTDDTSQLVFSRENGLLLNHPITRGRGVEERVNRVVTFTGTSLRGPEGTAFLQLGSSAVDYSPDVKVERSGADTRVTVNYVNPHPSIGNAQGLALEVGRGRIVVMGEAAALTAQRDREGRPIGMSLDGNDNRQLALNIIHWLSRAYE